MVPFEELFLQNLIRYEEDSLSDDANPFSYETWSTLAHHIHVRLISKGHPDLNPAPSKYHTPTIVILPPDADPSDNTLSESASAPAFAWTPTSITDGWGASNPLGDVVGWEIYLAEQKSKSDQDAYNWHSVHDPTIPTIPIPPISILDSCDYPPFVTANGSQEKYCF